ncbi:MAG: phosphate acyltransferase, partial [Lentisphaerota bacterium]
MTKTVLDTIRTKARSLGRKIVLTESDDVRNLQAAAKLALTGYAKPILVGQEAAIQKLASENGVRLVGVEVVDVEQSPRKAEYIKTVLELRKSKGLTEDQARAWLKDTCAFAAAMVCAGDAHGYVSGGGNPKGYNHDTGSKTKPALQLFKTAPGIKTTSAYFIMQMPDPKWGFNGAMFYADCGLVINPNADQLAEIAVTTARTFRALTGDEPRVGMISCSTKGSAKDPIIDKVIEATAKARLLDPSLKIDGEFQF